MTVHSLSDLKATFAHLHHLESAASVLRWDAAVMMPTNSGERRGAQLAALDRVRHETLSSDELLDRLESVRAPTDDPDGMEAANLAAMRRLAKRARALSAADVEDFAHATTRAELVWRRAKAENNFSLLVPALDAVLSLVRRRADRFADTLGLESYDALLDEYDPGQRSQFLDSVFAPLAQALPELLAARLSKGNAPTARLPMAVHDQRALGRVLAERMGFSLARGRIDESAHPFTEGGRDDIRITARFEERDFLTGLMGVVHETGHALYDSHLPGDWHSQPIGADAGMAIHESQSLFFEMCIGRTEAFAAFVARLLRETNNLSPPSWSERELTQAITRVERGIIRTQADELSYVPHILLRYELEPALLNGSLKVRELAEAWRAASKHLLGIEPTTDAEGCLQDTHWPAGLFGYFPSYGLGLVIASQLFSSVNSALSGLDDAVAQGDFVALRGWLEEQIWRHGARFSAEQLTERATGMPIDANVFLAYLAARHGS